MSKPTKIKLNKLLVIIVSWMMIGTAMALYDHAAFHSEYSLGTSAYYSFLQSLTFNTLAGLMGAVLGGSFLIFFVNEKYRERPYGQIILIVAVSFVTIVIIITVVFGLVLSVQRSGESLLHANTMREFKNYVIDPMHLKNILWWAHRNAYAIRFAD